MPSHSRAQHRMMEAVAHDPKLAQKLHIGRDVAEDFVNADKENKDYRKRDHVAPSHADKK